MATFAAIDLRVGEHLEADRGRDRLHQADGVGREDRAGVEQQRGQEEVAFAVVRRALFVRRAHA